MGWFTKKIKKMATVLLIFVPEWGWVGSLDSIQNGSRK